MDATDPTTRLTIREKEVLRAWLAHKSAKEIALDLGITHHAVEKRLKMARTKLGAASSLEAARMLAAVEGYGQAVTARSDISPSPVKLPLLRYRSVLLGAIAMSLAIILAVASLAPNAPSADAPPKATIMKLDPDMTAVFDTLDEDASGYLEQPESPFVAMAILESADPNSPETLAVPGNSVETGQIARFYGEADTDRDARVSYREFHVWNTAQLAAAGGATEIELKIAPLPQS